MEKACSLLLLFTLFMPFIIMAEVKNVSVDDINYTINTEELQASVRGTAMGNTNVVIPGKITYQEKQYTVTGIQDHAFYQRTDIVSVSLPSSITWIDNYAFCNSGITSIVIPSSVTSIGYEAFGGCKSMATLSLNSSLTIGSKAFEYCSSLLSVSIPSGSEVGGYAFTKCTSLTSVVIPSNVTLGSYVFSECTGLTTAIIRRSDTGEGTFYGCTSLTNVIFDSMVKTIGKECFGGCTGMTSFVVPNTIEKIDDGAFCNCTNLTSLTLGSGLKTMGSSYLQYGIVFGCTNLQKIIIPDIASWCNVDIVQYTSSDKRLFYNARLYSDENTEITKLVIPEGVTTIKKYAFYGCKSIESVSIASTVESIGEQAFEGCPITKVIIPDVASYCNVSATVAFWDQNSWMDLYSDDETKVTDLVIPEGVTTIGSYLFGRFNITSLTLPNSLKTIDAYAFYGCSYLNWILMGKGLESVHSNSFYLDNNSWKPEFYIIASTPPTYNISYYAARSKNLHVPESSANLYKAANGWKDFRSIIALKDGDIGYDELMGAVTLKAQSYSRVYGDANPSFDFSVTKGTIDSGSPVLSCSATPASPVGIYDIVIEKGTVSNGKVNLVKGTLTVTPAPLTISAGNYVKVQGEENPVFTPIYSGFKNMDTEEVLTQKPVLMTTASVSSPAGSYPVTASGAEAVNYDITYEEGTLTITSAAEAFESYKSRLISKADECILIINAAKEAISALSYNELKTLKENKDGADALMNKLAHDLATKLGAAGDANGDGKVTVTDIGVIVDIILGKTTASSRKMQQEVEPQ